MAVLLCLGPVSDVSTAAPRVGKCDPPGTSRASPPAPRCLTGVNLTLRGVASRVSGRRTDGAPRAGGNTAGVLPASRGCYSLLDTISLMDTASSITSTCWAVTVVHAALKDTSSSLGPSITISGAAADGNTFTGLVTLRHIFTFV